MSISFLFSCAIFVAVALISVCLGHDAHVGIANIEELHLDHHSNRSHTAFEHKCIHDSPIMKEISKRDFRILEQRFQSAGRGFEAQETGNLRIVFSTLDLEDSSKYCASVGQSNVPNFLGGTANCTAEDIFTDEKKAILINQVLPAAAELLSNALLVDRAVGNLNVATGCSYFQNPASYAADGVPNADFVLYVAAAPTTDTTVAWASSCSVSNKRPITGKANFSPHYLSWGSSTRENNQLVRTAAHELLHALGFSSSFWASIGSAEGKTFTTTETRRGLSKTVMVSTSVVTAAQTYFGCSTLTGPEIEDEGGSGTVGSHWERRTHFDDIMSGVTGDTMALSSVTLGLLEDLGSYTIDYSKAETPAWGKNLGCGLHNSKCNVTGGGLGTIYCNPETSTPVCTFDYRAQGVCSVATGQSIPAAEQYFSDTGKGGNSNLMNFCPIVVGYSNQQCDDATSNSADTTFANYYGSDGMCFDTTADVLKNGFSGSAQGGRCLRTLCQIGASGALVVQFKVGDSSWIVCPSTGTVLSLASYGYQGSVTCPDPSTHCTAKTTPADNSTAATAEVTTTQQPTTDPNATATTTSTSTTTTTVLTTTTITVPPNSPTGPNPVVVKPNGPVLASASFYIVGDTVTAMLNSLDSLLPAVVNDVSLQLGVNESGSGVTVNRYAAVVVSVAGTQYPAISVQLLISSPDRSAGFLLQLWQYALNQTSSLQAATWMAQTQALYAQSSSGAPFSVSEVKVTAPTKQSDFLAQCGSVGCIVTAAVATIGAWAGVVLVAVAAYQCVLWSRKTKPAGFAPDGHIDAITNNEPKY